MKYDARLKKRIHLVKRIMGGERLVNMAEDIDVSMATLKRYIHEVQYLAHWIGIYAGMETNILSVTPTQLRKDRLLYKPLIDYFDDQSASFEKAPTVDYPFIYLDLPSTAQRPIESFVRTCLGGQIVPTIRQVVEVFNQQGIRVEPVGLGAMSKLKLIETLQDLKMDFLWREERRVDIQRFVNRYAKLAVK